MEKTQEFRLGRPHLEEPVGAAILPYQEARLNFRAEVEIAHDFHLVAHDSVILEDYYHEVSGKGSVSFQFRLSGRSTETFGDFIETVFDAPGLYFASYPREMEKKATVGKGVHLTLVSLVFRPAALMRTINLEPEDLPEPLNRFVKGEEVEFIFRPLPMTIEMVAAANAVISPPCEGALRRLYLEAKSIELLCMACAALQSAESVIQPPVRFRSRDLDALHQARQTLVERLADPPLISDLALELGLNRTKLKYGFKYLFGTTIGEFCLQQRMEKAWSLLSERRMNVTEVAFDVGYSHTASFTKVFKSYFGFSPSVVSRDRHE